MLSDLPREEREVVELRFGLTGFDPLTSDQAVAERLGVSPKRAYTLHRNAIARLRGEDPATVKVAKWSGSAKAKNCGDCKQAAATIWARGRRFCTAECADARWDKKRRVAP